jgi:hypothetical protein
MTFITKTLIWFFPYKIKETQERKGKHKPDKQRKKHNKKQMKRNTKQDYGKREVSSDFRLLTSDFL